MTAPVKLAIVMPVEGAPETSKVWLKPQIMLRRIKNAIVIDGELELGPELAGNVDISRARDRMARVFLFDELAKDCTHLLWWDEDVVPEDLSVINRMIDSGHDVVGAPYRRKADVETYPYKKVGADGATTTVEVENDCVEVDALAFGFMITKRSALQAMWNALYAERWYVDVYQGKGHETVGMFDLQYSPVVDGPNGRKFRTKNSEDYSFCETWRSIGGRVMMYIGPGSPVGHAGGHVYTGTIEGLARAR